MKKGLLIAALMCCTTVLWAQTEGWDDDPVEETQSAAQVPAQSNDNQQSNAAQLNDEAQFGDDAQFAEEVQPVNEPQPEYSSQAGSEDEVKGAHPYDETQNVEVAPESSHWSILLHAGFSSFDGDFTSEMKHNIAVPTVGLGIEYSFTPVWGIGVEYMYDMYTVTGKPGFNNADTLLNGHMHKAGAFLTLDLFNLFFPKLETKLIGITPYIGGGVAWYKRNKVYFDDAYYDAEKGQWINRTHKRGNTIDYVNRDGDYGTPDRDTSYNSVGYLQAGVNIEFNINRSFAIGVRANYSYFTRDYVDGRGYGKNPVSNASKNNDGIFDITLNMRYKIQPVKYTHVRNLTRPGQYDSKKKNDDMQPCHDTIIIRHDSIIVRETFEHIEHTEEIQNELEQYYYVYFENNKSNIDDKGLITIQQVAERLQEDSSLYAVVTGYCDNTGSDKLNFALGDKRASNVVDELENEHKIDPERMYGKGRGKVIGGRTSASYSYSPNRRASIRLVDKETFERLKLNLEEEQAARPEEAQTIPLSESARPEKVNIYMQRQSEEVIADKNTTLSKLARQYYDNTYCWVYIYIANKDKISNPNAIKPGTRLTVPELTAEEMEITKDQSLVLFSNARQQK